MSEPQIATAIFELKSVVAASIARRISFSSCLVLVTTFSANLFIKYFLHAKHSLIYDEMKANREIKVVEKTKRKKTVKYD